MKAQAVRLASLAALLVTGAFAGGGAHLGGMRASEYAFSIQDEPGKPLLHPLNGGMNAPLFQFADLDGDADLDLFVQIEYERLLYYENQGDSAHAVFRSAQLPFARPFIGFWFCFADIDGDGLADLVTSFGGTGMSMHRNVGSRVRPEFRPWAEGLKDDTGAEIALSPSSFLEFADPDCDGVLDMFTATTNGTIRHFENRTAEGGAPAFKLSAEAYQGLSFIKETPSAKLAKPAARAKKAHGSRNTVAFVDIDRDGDLDLAWGDFFDTGLELMLNEGSCEEPRFGRPSPIPAGGSLRTGGANLPRFADVDGDGYPELFVSVLGGYLAEPPDLVEGIRVFKSSSPEAPTDFRPAARNLLPAFDIGKETRPALADIDGDGLLDMLVGNQVDTSSYLRGKVYYYRNQGTPERADFVRSSADFLPGDSLANPAPAFCDIDGDGDFDLFVGSDLGPIRFYRNDGTRTAPRFTLADTVFQGIRPGRRSVPAFGDLDGDGDPDLLVGEARGLIKQYANKGTAQAPKFELEASSFQDLVLPEACALDIGDLDKDGTLDLVVGSLHHESLVFLNSGSAASPRFREGLRLPTPSYFTPALGDLDGDGDLDLLGGTFGGGLYYFEQESPVSASISGRKPAGTARAPGGPRAKAGGSRVLFKSARGWTDLSGRSVP